MFLNGGILIAAVFCYGIPILTSRAVMPYTGKVRGTMETYRNEEQMQCLAKSEGCSTLPVSLYLADRVSITGAQAALAVMLSMLLVGSLAKLEVFSENTRQMKMTTE